MSTIILGAFAVLGAPELGLAKHRQKNPQPTSSDPCAAPNAYVRERIDRIKVLQASAPKSNGSLFDMLGGQKDFDAKKSAQISQLRDDAAGVNALLVAGGCKSYDLDRELSSKAK
ncbi:MAG: hypothetical protein QM780_14240 [Hyphomicrobium sp.]|uniref:hypothetical protein n=1 Tax=Hyphomicrobium sp. TaxID=82 RepID=UPI0039E31286